MEIAALQGFCGNTAEDRTDAVIAVKPDAITIKMSEFIAE
jgi:hypothetical protein